jgi:MFS superfamily sulfate permease-like transporter
METPAMQDPEEAPRGDLTGLRKYWKKDLLSGFLVFLIALPLCLGISLSSGYPPVAGVLTAIIGSILTTFFSNSELTIKGPAAGLIVIVAGCIGEFTEIMNNARVEDPAFQAYRLALGVGVAAGVLQILFGLFRTGILGEFFPTSAVHGMLAAIGVIMSKEIHKVLGVAKVVDEWGSPVKEPLGLIREIPNSLQHMNPEIAVIGFISLAILFGLPFIRNKNVRRIPGPMMVVLVAIPLGIYFDLDHKHTYSFWNYSYTVGPEEYLVAVKPKMFGLFDEITFPNFAGLETFAGWKWVIMFALIGTLESLLSAKAVDLLDPYKRKTNLNRDILGVGIANTAASFVGGLPMISEIVRSKANIDNGAKTRFADMFHGLFLLSFVALLPALIHQIPLAALSAMLVYTGFRLASPREFQNVFKIGIEQLIIFVVTLVAVLATDLLIGIAIGIACKFIIHIINGVSFRSFFKPYLEVEHRDDHTCVIVARQSAVFSNWIPFKRQIEQLGLNQRNNVIVDLSDTHLVDHSVMEKLKELQQDFVKEGLRLDIIGLEMHQQFSGHALAARKRGLVAIRRITIITEAVVEAQLITQLAKLGATGYTKFPCGGAGRQQMLANPLLSEPRVLLEVLVPRHVADAILNYLAKEISTQVPITTCVETVEVMSQEDFNYLAAPTKVPQDDKYSLASTH